MKEQRQLARISSFDTAYIRGRAQFAPFEPSSFDALCEFVRVHFDNLMDHYYQEGHDALHDFPAWAFERYLRETVP